MNTQGMLLEKKTFKTGCGTKLNYTFVPAIATALYEKYTTAFFKANIKVQEQNAFMNDPDKMAVLALDPNAADKFNQDAQNNLEKMIEVNKMGDELILLILSKNNQKEEITIDYINNNMTTGDKVSFLTYAVIGDPDSQKKNIQR